MLSLDLNSSFRGIRTSDVSKVKIHLGEHNVEQNEGSDDYMVPADRIIVHPQRVRKYRDKLSTYSMHAILL